MFSGNVNEEMNNIIALLGSIITEKQRELEQPFMNNSTTTNTPMLAIKRSKIKTLEQLICTQKKIVEDSEVYIYNLRRIAYDTSKWIMYLDTLHRKELNELKGVNETIEKNILKANSLIDTKQAEVEKMDLDIEKKKRRIVFLDDVISKKKATFDQQVNSFIDSVLL
jgi:hypothetical protein|uniref:Uncharacterized protein n=1 Tax=viral metagenome TaxID=1070528 RepID=A0A6C0BPK3_9ZZZZ